ncbi:unnamed protein product [Rhizophagus irregularis]|uniref:Uncharacterized protein n=1 Tax=Rhizophagus irregularis TaxID=588596 RepID=A0A915YXF0_9GLOM|nr:unnamed protein product [Rhizophagus irregularis]
MNLYYQSTTDESFQSEIYRNLEQDKTDSSTNSRLFTSKIHQFENLPEPKNATEAFHSNKYDFNIPNNIDDFNKSSEIMQQTKGRPNIGDFNDEDETYNNPNFHSEEQNELEIPDDV